MANAESPVWADYFYCRTPPFAKFLIPFLSKATWTAADEYFLTALELFIPMGRSMFESYDQQFPRLLSAVPEARNLMDLLALRVSMKDTNWSIFSTSLWE